MIIMASSCMNMLSGLSTILFVGIIERTTAFNTTTIKATTINKDNETAECPPDVCFYQFLTFGFRDYGAPTVSIANFDILTEVPMQDDVVAIMNINLPSNIYKNPDNRTVELIDASESLGRVLVMQPAVQGKVKDTIFEHSFGLSISKNIGYNVSHIGFVGTQPQLSELTGIVYVKGEIDGEKIMFGAIHGNYQKNETGLRTGQLINLVVLEKLFKLAEEYRIVLLGTFYLSTEELKTVQDELGFEMEDGPLYTNYGEHAPNTNVHHILVKNCSIVKQPTVVSGPSDHEWYSGVIVNILKEMIANPPIVIKPSIIDAPPLDGELPGNLKLPGDIKPPTEKNPPANATDVKPPTNDTKH